MSSSLKDLTGVYPIPRKVSSDLISEYPLNRSLDFIVASLALIISSVLWLIFSVAIKIEDRGPVFYRQKRWGKNKKTVKVYKFRTMVVNADEKFGRFQALENDPRITRVGKFLRATSLDEMPQILNIWKGEMSWVGPRALPINEVQVKEENGSLPDEEIPGFDLRGQVQGRPLQRNPESMSSARTSVTAFLICHITRRQRINHLLK